MSRSVAAMKAIAPLRGTFTKEMTAMKSTIVFILTAASAFAGTENFDKSAGAPPKGWTSAVTGSGASKWTVEKDDTAPSKPNVLKQSGEGAYPLS